MLRHAHLRPNYTGLMNCAARVKYEAIVDVYDGSNRWITVEYFASQEEARTFVRRVAKQAREGRRRVRSQGVRQAEKKAVQS